MFRNPAKSESADSGEAWRREHEAEEGIEHAEAEEEQAGVAGILCPLRLRRQRIQERDRLVEEEDAAHAGRAERAAPRPAANRTSPASRARRDRTRAGVRPRRGPSRPAPRRASSAPRLPPCSRARDRPAFAAVDLDLAGSSSRSGSSFTRRGRAARAGRRHADPRIVIVVSQSWKTSATGRPIVTDLRLIRTGRTLTPVEIRFRIRRPSVTDEPTTPSRQPDSNQ